MKPSLSALAHASLAAALLLTGCGLGTPAAPSGGDPLTPGATTTMAGTVFGGNQPIIGATVSLFSVGTSGYGSPGTLYATATTAGANGMFYFTQTTAGTPIDTTSSTYGCPIGSDPEMYLLAQGGDPGLGAANPAAAGIVAIGPCSTAKDVTVDINEVTTAATIVAMQQFFNPSQTISGTTYIDSLGAPSGTGSNILGQLGLANARATISNLVNIQYGVSYSSMKPPSSVTGVTMTATPESTKLNTVANILAACINTGGALTSGDPCSTLFANAVPQNAAYTSQSGATFTTATDTVQAAYYMFTNPTQGQDNGTTGKLHNLYNLVQPLAPFQPTLATQPLDWTIGIQYYPGTSSTSKCTGTGLSNTGGSAFAFFNPTMNYVVVDAGGNLWFSGGSSGSAITVGKMSPTGSPLLCPNLGATTLSLGLAIDTAGDIFNLTATKMYDIPTSGSGTAFNWTVSGYGGISTDSSGNLFLIPTAATGSIQKYAGTTSYTSATGVTSSTATAVGATIGTAGTYQFSATDSTGRLFANLNTPNGHFLDLFPDTASGNHATGGYYLSNIANTSFQSTSYGVAVDSSDSVFAGNTCCANALNNTFYKLSVGTVSGSGDTTTPTVTATQSAKYIGGVVAPRGLAIDGVGNLWFGMADPVLNAAQAPGGADVYAIGEVTNDLSTGLSPNGVTPATCTSTGPDCQTNGGFQKASLQSVISLAIDPSGNVWAVSHDNPGNITEIVGQAVPTITPIVNGRGTQPIH